jgi:hypothetical protein
MSNELTRLTLYMGRAAGWSLPGATGAPRVVCCAEVYRVVARLCTLAMIGRYRNVERSA